MDLDVGLGADGDVDSLEALWKAMVEHHRALVGHEWPIRTAEQAWSMRRRQYREWLADGSGLLFVARRSQSAAPVGYAFCRLIPSGPTFDLGSRWGEIDSLCVLDTARGLGVGSALLQTCRDELRRRGISHWSIGVVEANRDAIRLYERLGFRPWTRTMLAPVDP